MSEKLIVHFKELPVHRYNMDYLTYCKHCGTYNLGNKSCVKCEQSEEITLEAVAQKTVVREFLIRQIVIVGLYIIFFILTKGFEITLLCTLLTIAYLVLNTLIYNKYKKDMILNKMSKYVSANIDKIKEDLSKQMGMAIRDVEANNVVEAYDRFRYLSKLIDTDEIRIYKLICLRNFKLRRDMPLELKELLQEEYNSYLVDYIYEVSKIKKELVDDATLAYIIKYKEEVLMKHKGKKIMGSILSSALKSRFLFIKYAEEMPGYLKYFSRDRLLRVCKMSKNIKDSILRYGLLQEVKAIVGDDEDFIDYF